MIRETLSNAITLYVVGILVVIVASWIPQLRTMDVLGTFVRGCDAVVGPYLALWRRVIPSVSLGGMALDLSPIVAIVVLSFGGRLLVGMLPM